MKPLFQKNNQNVDDELQDVDYVNKHRYEQFQNENDVNQIDNMILEELPPCPSTEPLVNLSEIIESLGIQYEDLVCSTITKPNETSLYSSYNIFPMRNNSLIKEIEEQLSMEKEDFNSTSKQNQHASEVNEVDMPLLFENKFEFWHFLEPENWTLRFFKRSKQVV